MGMVEGEWPVHFAWRPSARDRAADTIAARTAAYAALLSEYEALPQRVVLGVQDQAAQWARALWLNEQPKPATDRESKENKVSNEKLVSMMVGHAPAVAKDDHGSTVLGRVTQYHPEPVVMLKRLDGTEMLVKAATVRELSQDERRDFDLAEREQRAFQREQDARVALRDLREVLTEAIDDATFGRVAMPKHVQEALIRLAEREDMEPTEAPVSVVDLDDER